MTYPTTSLRDCVGKALNAAFDPRMVVLDGDLSGATRSQQFEQVHPDHFIECGISETSGVSIATGLAMEGMIPFYVNFALFCTGSAWTQVRMACYAGANLKLIATHPGMDNGPDGASHHGDEDLALMRVIPGMRILIPASEQEVYEAVRIARDTEGPCYIRVSRDVVPIMPEAAQGPFGGAKCLIDSGDDFAIVCEGTAMMAARGGFDLLQQEGLRGRLIQIQTLKPFPDQDVWEMVKNARRVVTVENHTILGGLGGAMAEMLSSHDRHPMLRRVGIPDVFTQSGLTAAIKARYGLSAEHVAKAGRP